VVALIVFVAAMARELGARPAEPTEASWVALTVTACAVLGPVPAEAAWALGKEVASAAEQEPPPAPKALLVALTANLWGLVVMLLRSHSATGPHPTDLCS